MERMSKIECSYIAFLRTLSNIYTITRVNQGHKSVSILI